MVPAIAASALIVVIDQLTKRVMLRRPDPAPRGVITSQPGLVAIPARVAIPLWIGTATAVMLAVASKGAAPEVAVGIGLGIGGAFSNLADRVMRGGVVDFIAIGRWPPFNLADAALVAGFGLIAAALL